MKEMGGERNAVELERGFHGMERVVVLEEDLGDQIRVARGLKRWKQRV